MCALGRNVPKFRKFWQICDAGVNKHTHTHTHTHTHSRTGRVLQQYTAGVERGGFRGEGERVEQNADRVHALVSGFAGTKISLVGTEISNGRY